MHPAKAGSCVGSCTYHRPVDMVRLPEVWRVKPGIGRRPVCRHVVRCGDGLHHGIRNAITLRACGHCCWGWTAGSAGSAYCRAAGSSREHGREQRGAYLDEAPAVLPPGPEGGAGAAHNVSDISLPAFLCTARRHGVGSMDPDFRRMVGCCVCHVCHCRAQQQIADSTADTAIKLN